LGYPGLPAQRTDPSGQIGNHGAARLAASARQFVGANQRDLVFEKKIIEIQSIAPGAGARMVSQSLTCVMVKTMLPMW
jgi:hypothetical protein